jgi:hypothetical protein
MALINCPKCNNPVSDSAYSCPKCDTNIQEHLKMLKENKEELKEIEEARQRKNAKCPDCKQGGLSWKKYSRINDWGGSKSIIYVSNCKNCGYRSDSLSGAYSYTFLEDEIFLEDKNNRPEVDYSGWVEDDLVY